MARRLLPALLAVVALSACQFPRDTDGTLDRVRGGVLRVGVIEHEPWVSTGEGRPTGVEVALIDGFAREIGAEVEFTTGAEEQLIGALHEGGLDLVAGGMTKRSPWKKEASPTRPFATSRLVLGMPEGAAEPEAVVVERGSEAVGLVERKLDARPEPVEDLHDARGRPAAVHDWLLDDLGLRAGEELQSDEHVMFVRMGENAFQVELERYLEAHRDAVPQLLEQEGRP
jgi:polar amino acid transport system substrate-binding protein